MTDIIRLSSLRWDSLRQGPRHPMSAGRPVSGAFFSWRNRVSTRRGRGRVRRRDCVAFVVTPRLREGPDDAEAPAMEQSLPLDELFVEYDVRDYILRRCAPTVTVFAWRLDPLLVVYDRVDESPSSREAELLYLADLTVAGEYCLHEAMSRLFHNVHVPVGFSLLARRTYPNA